MASLLPNLPIIVLFLACLGFQSVTVATAQDAAGAGQGGQELVARAARLLQAESSIRAQIRCRFGGFGQDLVGTGTYLQLGDGPEKLLRLDLKVQLGNSAAVMQQISGEQFYWTRRDMPGSGVRLGRVDLRVIRQAIGKAEGAGQGTAPGSHDAWLLLGGLPALMENLNRNFDFGASRRDNLEFPSATGNGRDQLPVWIVEGVLKPDRLKQLAGDRGRAAVQLPTRVQLVLGGTEKIFPLFPYRVAYHHNPAALPASEKGGAGQGGEHLLAQLEFFGVQHTAALDPRDFEYNPGQQEVQEMTVAYLQKLGLAAGK